MGEDPGACQTVKGDMGNPERREDSLAGEAEGRWPPTWWDTPDQQGPPLVEEMLAVLLGLLVCVCVVLTETNPQASYLFPGIVLCGGSG